MSTNIAEMLKGRSLEHAVAARYKADFPNVPGTDPAHIDLAANTYAAMVAPYLREVKVSRGAETAIKRAQAIRKAQEGESDINVALIRAAEATRDAGRKKIGLCGQAGEILGRALGRTPRIRGPEPITVFQAPAMENPGPQKKTRKQERTEALPANRVRKDKNRALFTGLDPRTGRYYEKGHHRPPKNK